LGVTFATASILQGVAVANSRTNNEPYVTAEAAKPLPPKPMGTKERLTSQNRDRSAHTTAQVGL
jgi:hypothetical protein